MTSTRSLARPVTRRIRRGAAAAAVAVLAASLAACGSNEPRSLLDSIRAGHVVLGAKYDQPALGLRHPDGSMSGFDIDVSTYVVNEVADEMGVDRPSIEWKETPSPQRETIIANGEVDMIAATYSINKSRSTKVSFAGPYLVNQQGLLVRLDDSSLKNVADLDAGGRLCSVTGSTPAQNVKKQLSGVQLQEFDTYASCVEALHRGKVDALTTDEVILGGFSQQYDGEFRLVDMVNQTNVCEDGTLKKEKGKPFSTERYGIGVRLGDTATVDAINKALSQMMSSGEWEKALRANIGDEVVDNLKERAASSGSDFIPTPGNLDFLAPSDPKPCGGDS